MFRLFLFAAMTLVMLAGVRATAQVKITPQKDRVSVEIDGKPYTTFFIGPDTNKPYLDPLRTAGGTIVTRRYPMEKIEGEAHDHPHHRGLWFSHGNVNGVDFWSNETGQSAKGGKIVLTKVLVARSGKERGELAARFEWRGTDGKPLLSEIRRMTFYSNPKLRIIDVDVELTALTSVSFNDTKEGTFAIRLGPGLSIPDKGQPQDPAHPPKMLNAEGAVGEENIWGKRSNWVDYSGVVDGKNVGIAIFDHPENPRHPTYWHARAYGLFAANIFGVHDFEHDKAKDGAMKLEPKQKARFRYRVVIHEGDAESAGIAGLYGQYTGAK